LERSEIPVTIHQYESLARVSLRQSPAYIIGEGPLKLKEVLRQDSPLVVTMVLSICIREHIPEQVAGPLGRGPECMLFHGDDPSLLGEDTQAFEELLDACWRPKGFELVAVGLDATALALRDGVCDPVLMAIDEVVEFLASPSANTHDFLSGKVREDIDFELVG
jgi:hypothetical protein